MITGASTGIGSACAVHLARAGWTVLAGVRRPSDADRLAASANRVHPLTLDVTSTGDVASLAERVTSLTAHDRLDALVNNAGIVVASPVECVAPARLRDQLEVNLIGVVTVTQALLPHLRRARGRIVNVSSISGRVALPLLGPYAASKFALEAVSDALRVELRPEGIGVTLIEPGNIRTPIWEKSRDAAVADEAAWTSDQRDRYRGLLDAAAARITAATRRGLPPERVARVIHATLRSRRPPARRLVGVDARLLRWLDATVPTRVRDAVVASRARRR